MTIYPELIVRLKNLLTNQGIKTARLILSGREIGLVSNGCYFIPKSSITDSISLDFGLVASARDSGRNIVLWIPGRGMFRLSPSRILEYGDRGKTTISTHVRYGTWISQYDLAPEVLASKNLEPEDEQIGSIPPEKKTDKIPLSSEKKWWHD